MLFNKEKKLFSVLNNYAFEGALFVYDFKTDRIVVQNDAMARLFGYENKEEFSLQNKSKISKVVGAKTLDKINYNYKNGIRYFTMTMPYFTKDNRKKFVAMICNIVKGTDYMYSILIDVTEQMEFRNQLENNFLQDTSQKKIALRSLLINFELVIKVDMSNFKAYSISIDGEDVKETAISTDWNDYYSFVLNLMSYDSAERLKNYITKEGLVKLLNESQYFSSEEFTSAFSIKSASKTKQNITYDLIVEFLNDNDKKYAFILIKPQKALESKNGSFEAASFLTTDYSSVFVIDEETREVTVRYTTERFKKFYHIGDNLKMDYYYAINKYCNAFVYEDDREYFREALINDDFFKQFKNAQSYMFRFRRIFDGVVDKAMFYFLKAKSADNKDEIILAVRDSSNDESTDLINAINKDSLTEVYNFSGFYTEVENRIKDNFTGYVIRFDIDDFSRYNHLFGVLAGDKMLAKVGNELLGLERDFNIVSGRFGSDIFLVYLKGTKDDLDLFVEKLKKRVTSISRYYDFVITVGVYAVKDNGMDVRDMIEGAALAAETIKDRYEKTYRIYDEEIRKNVVDRTNRLTSTVEALKDDKIKTYYRYIYCNNKISGYDFNIRLDSNITFKERNLYLFLEANGLSLNVNRTSNEKILKFATSKDRRYLLYITKHFLVKKGEIDRLIEKVDEYNINHNQINIVLQPNISGNEPAVYDILKKLRELNFNLMFDYTTYTSFDFRILYELGVTCLKIDANNFNPGSHFGTETLYQIANLLTSSGYRLLIAHASEEQISHIKKFENICYTKDDDKVYDLDDYSNN